MTGAPTDFPSTLNEWVRCALRFLVFARLYDSWCSESLRGMVERCTDYAVYLVRVADEGRTLRPDDLHPLHNIILHLQRTLNAAGMAGTATDRARWLLKRYGDLVPLGESLIGLDPGPFWRVSEAPKSSSDSTVRSVGDPPS